MKKFFYRVIEMNKAEFVTAILGFIGLLIFVPVFTYYYFAKDLTTKESIMNRNSTGVTLLDRNGELFFQFYEAHYKTFVPLSEIPDNLQNAVIVTEDREFYKHPGFSIKSILGAMVANVRHRKLAYGGSTITQQLVKNTLLTSQKNFLRKYQEIILAQEIERRYTKKQILEMYLNSVYFGEGAFGVEEAAKVYFNTSAKNLTLSESALLAGLITAPSELSPISGNREKSRERQQFVLQELVEKGYITQAIRAKAEAETLSIQPEKELRYRAPHFALMVKDELIRRYGEEYIARSGFTVKTSLDLQWQSIVESVVKAQVEKLRPDLVTNGAAVVMDPKTGEIRALVGSFDWSNNTFGKLNMATAPRQPGSSFKPLVYAIALEKHIITPATILKDEPITYQTVVGPYRPQNYDRRFRGRVTVRRALANSLNIPAVEVMQKLGVPTVLDSAKRFGITTLGSESDYGLSLVLGSGEVPLTEMTNVFATFANQGKRSESTIILTIYDKLNKTVYNYQPHPEEVLKPEYAFLISSILSDNKVRSEVFGNVLTISKTAAVKTGTTEDYRDSLTLGYTPSLAIGVWVGNNDNKPMNRIAGSLGAAPIWKQLMEKFLEKTPDESFSKPANIVSSSICSFIGSTASKSAMVLPQEFFVSGTQPSGPCVLPTMRPLPSLPVVPTVSGLNPSQTSLSPTQSVTNRSNSSQGQEKKKKKNDD